MLDVLGEIFPLAIGTALSPLPIIATVLLLLGPDRGAGIALLLGRLIGLAAVVSLTTVLAEFITIGSGSSTLVSVLRIVLGGALLVLGVTKWRGRPEAGEATMPVWMASVQTVSGGRAARLGLLLTIANPKELAFCLGAGLTIGAGALPLGSAVIVLIIYLVLACITVIVPIVAVLTLGDRIRPPLEAARTWLVQNNQAIIAIIVLLIGAILIGEGIAGL